MKMKERKMESNLAGFVGCRWYICLIYFLFGCWYMQSKMKFLQIFATYQTRIFISSNIFKFMVPI